MQKTNGMRTSLLVTMLILMSTVLFFSQPVNADDWRYPLGISYASIYGRLGDAFEGTLEADEASDTDAGAFPLALTFQPYLQFDNGMRIGAGIGPCSYMIGNVDFIDTPINFNAGYTFNAYETVFPYIRMGIIRHVIAGDYATGNDPGVFGAAGVEFFRDKKVSYGIEIMYDSCELKAERKKLIKWVDIGGTLQPYNSVQRRTDRFKVGLSLTMFFIF